MLWHTAYENIVNTDAQKRGTEHQRENVYFAEEIHDAGRGKRRLAARAVNVIKTGVSCAKNRITSNRMATAEIEPMRVASEEAVEAASSLMSVTPAL